jgi:hypothetical protein
LEQEAYILERYLRLGANAESKIIDAYMSFYQTNVKDICDATSTFLKKIN